MLDLIDSVEIQQIIYAMFSGFLITLVSVYIIRWFFYVSVFWLVLLVIVCVTTVTPLVLMPPPLESLQSFSLNNLPSLKPYGLFAALTLLGAIGAYQFSRKEMY